MQITEMSRFLRNRLLKAQHWAYLRNGNFLFLVFEVLPNHQEVVFLQTALVAPATKNFLMTLKCSMINIARNFDATLSQIFKMVAFKPTFVSICLIGIWHFAQAGRVRRMDSSIIEVNGKLGMYLNVPSQCYTIYDSIIERLEACKSGRNLGHPNLDQGCLIQVNIIYSASKINSPISIFV